jgi:HD-like signal output (HDOD) protein
MSTTAVNLDQAQSIIKGINIPPRPAALQAVLAEKQKEHPDLNKLATIIAKDVTLAASVLKTINSPLYGLRRQITSIKQATIMLGFRTVSNLVTGISIRQATSGSRLKLERFWDSATDVAMMSSRLSKSLMLGDPENAYLLGLFHDVGIPLMMLKYPDYKKVLIEANDSNQAFTTIEEKYYPTNHAVVGYYVGRSWGIEKQVCQGILNHHSPQLLSLDDPNVSSLLAIMKLAEHICHLNRRLSLDTEWQHHSDDILEYLGLDEDGYIEVREEMTSLLAL